MNAHAPRFNHNGSIDLVLDHPEYGEIPFTASEDDIEEHGRDLYARAQAGEFGEVAPYVAPVETPEQVQARLTAAVQRHLDAQAKARGYDSILSACSYASAPNPYQAEGTTFLAWRGEIWKACYQVLTAMQAGNRPVPSEAELIAELPVWVLP